MKSRSYYFSTRDLLIMAALAALGGVTGTYINAIGDFFQSILGVVGTTQWAAGLHVVWLTLAVGLTGKQGAGTLTGILKGAVELLTGNTHGLLVLLIDIVAGLLVDLGFLPFRKKDSLAAYMLAGGLAAASNVFVFQLFASLPSDILAYGVITLVGGTAFLSGVLFAGLLGYSLLGALRRAGAVKDRPQPPRPRHAYAIFLITAIALTGILGVYLHGALKGPPVIHIGGSVDAAYDYPLDHGDIPAQAVQGTLLDVTRSYNGIPLATLIERSRPQDSAAMVLVKASDGYAFFISMDEVASNPALVLDPQGKDDAQTYNLVGAQNSKAWVRGVSEIIVVESSTLKLSGALQNPHPYDPQDWQFEMDNATIDVGNGPSKLQGAPLGKIIAAADPESYASTVILRGATTEITLTLEQILADDSIRVFSVIQQEGMDFAVARTNGDLLVAQLREIAVE